MRNNIEKIDWDKGNLFQSKSVYFRTLCTLFTLFISFTLFSTLFMIPGGRSVDSTVCMVLL